MEILKNTGSKKGSSDFAIGHNIIKLIFYRNSQIQKKIFLDPVIYLF